MHFWVRGKSRLDLQALCAGPPTTYKVSYATFAPHHTGLGPLMGFTNQRSLFIAPLVHEDWCIDSEGKTAWAIGQRRPRWTRKEFED